MRILLIAAAWMNIMYANVDANVEKGKLPGTYIVDQYGAPRNNPPPRVSLPTPKPSKPGSRR